jgi:hypothetical protein
MMVVVGGSVSIAVDVVFGAYSGHIEIP